MIAEFVASWPLFHNSYMAGWLAAVLLALVGVLVVARDQIFVGAAVSQASMLGITACISLSAVLSQWTWLASDLAHTLSGVLFAVLGALVSAGSGGRVETREAVTGWVFLVGASASILLVANSPHGLAEVQHLLASTLIGASTTEVLLFGALVAITASTVALRRETLLLLIMDPEMSRAVGLRVLVWDRLLAVWLGVTVAWAIHVAGVTYTFGCLVLPALLAKNIAREIGSMFIVAPLAALATSIVGFVVANHYDLPPGQTVVTLMALLVALGWAVRARRTS